MVVGILETILLPGAPLYMPFWGRAAALWPPGGDGTSRARDGCARKRIEQGATFIFAQVSWEEHLCLFMFFGAFLFFALGPC